MRSNRSIPDTGVIPELAYDDVAAAARWLANAFGFRERLRIADHRVQMTTGNGGAFVVMDRTHDAGAPRGHGTIVRVTEVDAHFARARAAGAEVIRAPETHMYGERQYTVRDIGGHRWTFSETVDDADPSTWGGELVE